MSDYPQPSWECDLILDLLDQGLTARQAFETAEELKNKKEKEIFPQKVMQNLRELM